MLKAIPLFLIAGLALGCQQPCRAPVTIAEHAAELRQCDRILDQLEETRPDFTAYQSDHLRCIADVEARYLDDFVGLGVDAAKELEEIRDGLDR